MARQARTVEPQFELRTRAVSRLGGRGAVVGAAAMASDALAALHDLASKPATAADALALLHELQVHQVEIDLQAEALRESRAELESALRRQNDLYDGLPVGCFTIDRLSTVLELNLTGAGLLGVAREDAIGVPLDSFLTPASGWVLREMLARVAQGAERATSMLELSSRNGAGRAVRGLVCAEPDGRRCSLVLVASDDDRDAPADPGR